MLDTHSPSKKWVRVLLVEIGLFYGIARKISQGPTHGRCGVARWFTWVEIEDASLVSNVLLSVCPAMEKAQLCPQQGQNKS